MFLFINVFVFQPAVIYTGALFMISMTGIDIDLIIVAIAFAVLGAAYAVLVDCALWLCPIPMVGF